MSKKILYPTWKYKSRKSYVNVKARQFNQMIYAMNKFYGGCAWLPKSVRDTVDFVKIEKAVKQMYALHKKVNAKP